MSKSKYRVAYEAAVNLSAFLQPLQVLADSLKGVLDVEDEVKRQITVRKEIVDTIEAMRAEAEEGIRELYKEADEKINNKFKECHAELDQVQKVIKEREAMAMKLGEQLSDGNASMAMLEARKAAIVIEIEDMEEKRDKAAKDLTGVRNKLKKIGAFAFDDEGGN